MVILLAFRDHNLVWKGNDLRLGQSHIIIYAINNHTVSCVDCCLSLIFIYTASADTNGMWCQVSLDDFTFMANEVMLSHHTLFDYNLYINYAYQM
jgi:hypothetical protein